MIRSFLLTCFTVTIITSPLLFPAHSTAGCDFEKTPISLKAVDQPVTEILKDIAKQAKYTIEIHNASALNNKKSIELDQAPLDLTLTRLLKDLNYSIICNDEQKTLTLVFLDKKGAQPNRINPEVSSSQRPATDSDSGSMDDITIAFEEYNNKEGDPTPVPEYQRTSMDGATDAFNDYNNKSAQPTLELEKQETSMDVVTNAFEGYNSKSSSPPETSTRPETSMDEATNAFEEYNNKDIQPDTELEKQETSMDGVTNAFEEYNTTKSSLP
ncbi:MAG: hypothetical protein KKI15_05370 [Proteobacteria bacterium]|nr:hypothetical protein [Pseudomonadota bacterium]